METCKSVDKMTTRTPLKKGVKLGCSEKYLCNRCLSPLMLWVRIPLLATGRWFSSGSLVSSTNNTYRRDITEILLKVPLSTINQSKPIKIFNSNFYKRRYILNLNRKECLCLLLHDFSIVCHNHKPTNYDILDIHWV